VKEGLHLVLRGISAGEHRRIFLDRSAQRRHPIDLHSIGNGNGFLASLELLLLEEHPELGFIYISPFEGPSSAV